MLQIIGLIVAIYTIVRLLKISATADTPIWLNVINGLALIAICGLTYALLTTSTPNPFR